MPEPQPSAGGAHTVELGEDAVQHGDKFRKYQVSWQPLYFDLLMSVGRDPEPYSGPTEGRVCADSLSGPPSYARALPGLSRSAALRARADTQPISSCSGLGGA